MSRIGGALGRWYSLRVYSLESECGGIIQLARRVQTQDLSLIPRNR